MKGGRKREDGRSEGGGLREGGRDLHFSITMQYSAMVPGIYYSYATQLCYTTVENINVSMYRSGLTESLKVLLI